MTNTKTTQYAKTSTHQWSFGGRIGKPMIAKRSQKPIEICRHCIDDDFETNYFDDDNWSKFNTDYCITHCNNNFVPKYLPEEQVIKYLKAKFKGKSNEM